MGIDKDKSQLTAATELRRHAEERLHAKTAQLHSPRNEEETQRLVHELEVHQIELEMQGEDFRQAKDDAEAALEKYADLYDFAPVGYLTLDHEGIICSINLTGASLFGIERSRLLGRPFGLLVTDESRPFFSEFFGKVFTNPAKEVCEVALLKEGNSPLFVRIEGVAAALGQECRIALIDITERKRSEESLRQSEERFRALTTASSDVIYRMSPDWSEMFHLRGQDFLADTEKPNSNWLQEYIHPDDQPHVEAVINEAIRTKSIFELEHRVLRVDGTLGWTFSRAIPLLDVNSKIYEWFGAASDITERKQAEEQLKASLAEKEVMLKEIHHRVKNNLQVISSLVGLQANSLADERMRDVFQDVCDRVRSMALVHEKLYQTGDLARIDFAEYAKSLLNYLWRAHGSATTAVCLSFDLEPLSLPMDTAVPCGLILNELAGNALKHAFRGRNAGEVIVSLKETPEGRISLSLRDNGVGLPAELDWQQTRSLGLRLVQMLAGQLGATVELDRSGGTEFTVSFELRIES